MILLIRLIYIIFGNNVLFYYLASYEYCKQCKYNFIKFQQSSLEKKISFF